METIKTVLVNITKGCYMSVLDLKDAYFSVKIAEEYQCFLKLEWDKCHMHLSVTKRVFGLAQENLQK